MLILHFLSNHWLLIGLAVLAIASVAAMPAQALLLARWLIGSTEGRKIVAAALALALAWILLVHAANHFKAIGAETQRQTDAKMLAGKDKALLAAAASLKGAGVALDQVNAAAAKAIADAKQAQTDANNAGQVALEAQNAAQLRMKAYDRDIQRARSNPTCDVLLRTDVAKVCGL